MLRAGLEPATCRFVVDNQTTSARSRNAMNGAGPPGIEPGPARLELAMLPVTPQAWVNV
jgi:hypothetical protein